MIWPAGFCNIGGWSFDRVFKEKHDFVNFTVTCMESPTGIFKEWKEFCLKRKADAIHSESDGTESIT